MHQIDTTSKTQSAHRAYDTPILTEFGSIAELTQAGGGSTVEGSTPVPGKKP